MKYSLTLLAALVGIPVLADASAMAECPSSGGYYSSYPAARSYHGTRFQSFYYPRSWSYAPRYSSGFHAYSYRPIVIYRSPGVTGYAPPGCAVPSATHGIAPHETMRAVPQCESPGAPPVAKSGPPQPDTPPIPPRNAASAPESSPADDAPPLPTES